MDTNTVNLADAKARLSELAEQAAEGDTIVITKRGKPVAKLSRADAPRKPIDLAALQRLTANLPRQAQEAGEFVRGLREDARY